MSTLKFHASSKIHLELYAVNSNIILQIMKNK